MENDGEQENYKAEKGKNESEVGAHTGELGDW